MRASLSFESELQRSTSGQSLVRGPSMGRDRVAIIGASEWGTVLARAIGAAAHSSADFEDTVRMWVQPESLNGCRLCDVITDQRENPKYLPGVRLPINVVAEPSVQRAVSGASLIIFALPHGQALRLIPYMRRSFHPGARALCLVDGMQFDLAERPLLTSALVSRALGGMSVSVLVGADLLPDVVRGVPCELTLGCPDEGAAAVWSRLLASEAVHIEATLSAGAAELAASLAPVVALSAGFADGAGLGSNAKAAVVRLGLAEIRRLVGALLPEEASPMPLSACALAHLLGECYGGHSARSAAAFAQRGGRARWEEIEQRMLGGARVRGVRALQRYVRALRAAKLEDHFPLLLRTHEIALQRRPPAHVLPLPRHEREWRRLRARRICAGLLRAYGVCALACLAGVGVFWLQRAVLSRALHVERLGAGAAGTVDAASYCAAVCCVHSCLRWGLFGIGRLEPRALLTLLLLLSAGLCAALAAGERARRAGGPLEGAGWMGVVPAALALGFPLLAKAYVQQRLSDFLLALV